MKKILLLLFLFSITLAHAQEACRTPEYDVKRQEARLNLLKNRQVQSSYCLKIYVHLIRRTNGTGGQSVASTTAAINLMKSDFLPHNISFEWDETIDYIDNTVYFDNPGANIFSVNSHTDGIDIYLYGNLGDNFGQASANNIETAFLLSGSFDRRPPFTPYIETSVISHEMGHVLDLLHTHANCDNPSSYSPADNSNCNSKGDYVCDTAPDPGMDFWVDYPNCEWLGQTFCSDHLDFDDVLEYDPDESNIMAYTHPDCMQAFTPGQGQRMRASIAVLPLLQNATTTCTQINCRTGFLTMNDFVLSCPEFPIEVTGTFSLPNYGSISSLELSLLQGGTTIATGLDAAIDYTTNTYAFSINDLTLFGNPPSGEYEVQATIVFAGANGDECRPFSANTVLSPNAAISFKECDESYVCSTLENTSINGSILSWPDIGAAVYYIDLMPNSLCCNPNDNSVYGPMTTVEVTTNEFDLITMPDKCSMVRVYTRECPPTNWCCVSPSGPSSFYFPYGENCLPPPSSNAANSRITILPNPATNELTIGVDETKIYSIEIYNIYGLRVNNRQQLNSARERINVSTLPRGLFIIKVKLIDGSNYIQSIILK